METLTRNELRRALLLAASICALVLVALAYKPALDGTFVWDDHILAERDAAFRHVPLYRLFTSGFWPNSPLNDAQASDYYRPVVLLSLRADLALGDEARGFHTTNLLLHLLACILVAIVAIRTGARPSAGLLAALVWGLAPRITETVAWIAGRTDALATVFGLAAIALSPALDRSPDRPRRGREVATAGFLFLALASKEVAVAFAISLIIAHAKPRRPWRASVAIQVGAPLLLWVGLRAFALERRERPLRDLGAWSRMGTVLETLERYVEMTFDALRPRTSIGMVGDVDRTRAAIGAVLAVLLLVGLVLAVRRGTVATRVGLVLSAAAIAPILHVIPFALAGAVAADRLLYVPLAGLAIALATRTGGLSDARRRGVAAAAIAVATFFFVATRARAADYADEGRFWVAAAQHGHPRNPMPLRALAGQADSADQRELACRLHERARVLADVTAIAGVPAQRLTREGLAGCWIKLGRYEDGRALLEEVARSHPTHGRVWMELGYAREHLLDFDGATEAFTRARSLSPALVPLMDRATHDLARVRKRSEHFASAEARSAEPTEYANHLADIGHLPEAELAYFAVAQDRRLPDADRSVGALFVMTNGRIWRGEQLLLDPTLTDSPLIARQRLAPRQKRRDAFRPLLPSVEDLLVR